MFKSVLTEYGAGWVINRFLYSAKLKIMVAIPAVERIFEKKVEVKRIDIFNFDVKVIKSFLMELSEEKQKEIVVIADKAIDGIITGFSSIEMDFCNPINWHYSPITNKESKKNIKWYRIPDFDDKIGDIKAVWEASRFTHFFYFARAYLITGDQKYYIAFSDQLKQWLSDNLYPYGANYKCGQECTLRMINTLMVYEVFNYCGLTTLEDEKNVRKLVEVCYKKVLSNFFYAHKCIKNNHTFSEICGLIIGAWCCEDERRLREAYELLDRETETQFLLDGGYTQYSFNYQRFTLQIFECIYKISEKTGRSISDKSEQLIKNSALLMYQVQDITGDVPNYGSNDGALIFPLTVCSYRDFRPTLNTLHFLITGKRLYKQGDYDEELLWFSNESEAPLLAEVERTSVAFNQVGLYTLRHENAFMMICLNDFSARPSHMDGLHIDLWSKGRNIFCDSGTYSYASELGKQLSSTAGHNTVKIDGLEQMNKWGAFLIYDWYFCKDVKHAQNSFSGTIISKNGYEHTRKIQITDHGYQIDDEVCGNGDYCEFYFHTPYDVRIISDEVGIWNDNKLLCSVTVWNGKIRLEKAYRSLYYLKKQEINCIVIKCSLINKKCRTRFEMKISN